MAKQNRFTDSQWEQMISETKKISKTDVARKYGTSIQALSYQMNKRGSSYDEEKFIIRKHHFNQDFFETIDTEAKAYFLGFVIADGSVGRPTKWGKVKRLSINISNKDIEILEMFKEEIGAHTIKIETYIPSAKTYSQNPMSRLTLNSVKLCDDLKKYGVVKNKTGKEILPLLNEKLMPHLIRGFFDGDGSIYYSDRKSLVAFTNSEKLLNQLREYLVKNLSTSNKTSVTPAGKGKNAYQFGVYAKDDVHKFYHFIYDDANIYLNRKYEKYTSLLS